MNRSRLRQTRAKSDQRVKVLDEITPAIEFELLKRLNNYQLQLRRRRGGQSSACCAAVEPGFLSCPGRLRRHRASGREQAEILHATPTGGAWDATLLAAFLRGHKVTIPGELMLARIRRHGRMWGRWSCPRAEWSCPGTCGRPSPPSASRPRNWSTAQRAARAGRACARIDHKILEQIEPKDLFYQILHGLRSLVGYDHSAALLTSDNESRLAGGRGRTGRLAQGQEPAGGPHAAAGAAALGSSCATPSVGSTATARPGATGPSRKRRRLAELLDYNRDRASAARPRPRAPCSAPLVTRHGLVGVLKVASVHPGTFGAYEADIISQFLPQVAVALQNMRRTESLELRMQAAERKQAMADLARGVSHDVNNALGAVLPLVQQMQAELTKGDLEPPRRADDLVEIEHSLPVCRRIFGGCSALPAARHAARRRSRCTTRSTARWRLSRGARATGVSLEVSVPERPAAAGGRAGRRRAIAAQPDRNAATPRGRADDCTIRARRAEAPRADRRGHRLRNPREHLPKIQEPFFTTKAKATAWGCRSAGRSCRRCAASSRSRAAGARTTVGRSCRSSPSAGP